MTFEDLKLRQKTLEILKENGFKAPTDVQKEVIPLAMQHKSVIAISNTGSGKTLAFLIPIINDIVKTNQFYHSVILTPTRELASQIREVCTNLGKTIGLRVLSIVGGENESKQKTALFDSPHIIVGTPGRIHCILKKINLFQKLKFFVLDEADKLMEGIYATDLHHICANTPGNKSLLLFSATMTDSIQALANLSLEGCEIVKIGSIEQAPNRIDQKYILVPEKHKLGALFWICQNIQQKKIVFAKSCLGVQTLRKFLQNMNIDAFCMHGGLSQTERSASLQGFKAKDASVLIATDIAARGIDISTVEMIINYDLPSCSKEYLHRIGRTGRGFVSGTSVSFVSQYDIAMFQRIENAISVKMTAFDVDLDQIKVLEHKMSIAFKSAFEEVKDQAQSTNATKKRKRKRKSAQRV